MKTCWLLYISISFIFFITLINNCLCQGDFIINTIQSEQTVCIGYSTTFDILVQPLGDYSNLVSLTVQGLPSDIETFDFRPQTVIPRGYSILGILTSDLTATGSYILIIQGSDGSLTRQKQVTLNIVDEPYVCPDFSFPENSIGANRIIGYLLGENSPNTEQWYITKNPEAALGLPDGTTEGIGHINEPLPINTFYSVGLGGGYIELGIEGGSVVDQPGVDFALVECGSWDVRMESAEVKINGITRIIDQDYFNERLIIYVPNLYQIDESHWLSIYNIDLSVFGITQADRIKIVDGSGRFTSEGTAGFDVDGIAIFPESYGLPLECKAAIKSPNPGRSVNGNRITIVAEIETGFYTGDISILFQYRYPSLSGPWSDIIAADQQHPNPDTQPPFFIHWDVTTLSEGLYDLRAICSYPGYSDPNPTFVTIEIKHTGATHSARLDTDGHLLVEDMLESEIVNEISSADPITGTLVHLAIDASCLSGNTPKLILKFYLLGDFPILEDFAGLNGLDPAIQLTLQDTGIIDPSNTRLLKVYFHYKDMTNDGIVDGTTIKENWLRLYRYDGISTIEELVSTIDPIKNIAVGASGQTSIFSVIAKPETMCVYDFWFIYQ